MRRITRIGGESCSPSTVQHNFNFIHKAKQYIFTKWMIMNDFLKIKTLRSTLHLCCEECDYSKSLQFTVTVTVTVTVTEDACAYVHTETTNFKLVHSPHVNRLFTIKYISLVVADLLLSCCQFYKLCIIALFINFCHTFHLLLLF